MNDYPKSDPSATSDSQGFRQQPCPKCGNAMFDCTFYVMPHNVIKDGNPPLVRGMVCKSCGHSEFDAPEPERLIAAAERRKKKWWELLNPENW